MTNQTPRHRRRPARAPWLTLKRRRWLYGIAIAAVPVAIGYGWISSETAAPLVALAGAVLAIGGTALAHPTAEPTE